MSRAVSNRVRCSAMKNFYMASSREGKVVLVSESSFVRGYIHAVRNARRNRR
jgi:hypothetical protein